MMQATAAEQLAKAATKTHWSDLPENVQEQAKDLFLDTIAVVAAGLADHNYRSFAIERAKEGGAASVPGVTAGVSPHSAVQINGGATTVLQLQDGHRMARGHPASHSVPVLLALAEVSDRPATDVLAAFVAGYETGARIGIAMDGLNSFLHDTGTWSTIGAAVSAVHLRDAKDEAALQAAIETAAAIALMPYRDLPVQGASAHHLYIGVGAVTALTVAEGVAAGLVPLPGTLESFFGPRAGANFDPRHLTNDIGSSGEWSAYECLNAYFKVHPTCAHLHGANDATAFLIHKHALTAEQIDHVEISTYDAGLAFDNPNPENSLAARFSQAATCAIALCHGDLNERTLTDETLRADDVQKMMNRIAVSHDPDLDSHYPAGRPARVTVALKNGDTVTQTATYPLGDASNPLDGQARRAKVTRLLRARFTPTDADHIVEAFDAYCDGEPVAFLSCALQRPASD